MAEERIATTKTLRFFALVGRITRSATAYPEPCPVHSLARLRATPRLTLNLGFNFDLTLPMSGDRVLLPLVSLATFNNTDYIQPPRTDICDRTAAVEDAILAAVPFTVACGQVAEASLADIRTGERPWICRVSFRPFPRCCRATSPG